MAKELVVKEILTDEMINAGEIITRQLDAEGVPIKAALWFYSAEENTWRLFLASPLVNKEGPKRVYMKVRDAIGHMPKDQPSPSLKDISVVDEQDQLMSLLKIAIKTGQGMTGIRFSRNTINGQFIEDAYIYRLN
ncbi:MAG: hypothetical protein SVY10_18370 [Thermodesulfobacteriota bacterium]|nr:hypothetical protein [Thermodesulfobacteriota bacterium]